MAASNAEFANVSNVCVVDEEHIRDENPKAGVNSNFDVDWKHIYEPLRRILAERAAIRPPPRRAPRSEGVSLSLAKPAEPGLPAGGD